jgi:hypothetical protein
MPKFYLPEPPTGFYESGLAQFGKCQKCGGLVHSCSITITAEKSAEPPSLPVYLSAVCASCGRIQGAHLAVPDGMQLCLYGLTYYQLNVSLYKPSVKAIQSAKPRTTRVTSASKPVRSPASAPNTGKCSSKKPERNSPLKTGELFRSSAIKPASAKRKAR